MKRVEISVTVYVLHEDTSRAVDALRDHLSTMHRGDGIADLRVVKISDTLRSAS